MDKGMNISSVLRDNMTAHGRFFHMEVITPPCGHSVVMLTVSNFEGEEVFSHGFRSNDARMLAAVLNRAATTAEKMAAEE